MKWCLILLGFCIFFILIFDNLLIKRDIVSIKVDDIYCDAQSLFCPIYNDSRVELLYKYNKTTNINITCTNCVNYAEYFLRHKYIYIKFRLFDKITMFTTFYDTPRIFIKLFIILYTCIIVAENDGFNIFNFIEDVIEQV